MIARQGGNVTTELTTCGPIVSTGTTVTSMACFLDWSVRKIGLKELWTLKWNPQFDTSD